MKTLFAIILSVLCTITATAQTKNNTYIDQANVVNISKGNVYVGQLILSTSPGSRVLFKSFSQAIDTAKGHVGEYKTVFDLIPPDGAVLSKIITLVFDNPVISCELKPVGSGAIQMSGGWNKEKTGFRFVIAQLMCREFQFVIYSKEKIFTKIDGITGQVTQ